MNKHGQMMQENGVHVVQPKKNQKIQQVNKKNGNKIQWFCFDQHISCVFCFFFNDGQSHI